MDRKVNIALKQKVSAIYAIKDYLKGRKNQEQLSKKYNVAKTSVQQ